MYSSTLSLPRHLDGDGWSSPHPGRFTPGKDPVPIVQEAGWAPGLVWTGVKNLAPTRMRSPDRPARCELMYRLCCPSPLSAKVQYLFPFSFPVLLSWGEQVSGLQNLTCESRQKTSIVVSDPLTCFITSIARAAQSLTTSVMTPFSFISLVYTSRL